LTFIIKKLYKPSKQKIYFIMAKNTLFSIKPGKSDVIEGIIVGNQQINALNKMDANLTKPSMMIRKLTGILNNSSDEKIKKHAENAIKELEKFTTDDPLNEKERTDLLKLASKP